MKSEAYTYLHAFSAGIEQAWEAAQKLQPHLDLQRSQLKQTYYRLEEARQQTLAEWGALAEKLESAQHGRLIKQKTQWEAQEQERIRKRDEAEQARWAWEQRQVKQTDTSAGFHPVAETQTDISKLAP